MKYILTINYSKFLLPEGTNVDQLIRALAGNFIEGEWNPTLGDRFYYPVKKQPEIQLEIVNDELVLAEKPKQPALEPAPPLPASLEEVEESKLANLP